MDIRIEIINVLNQIDRFAQSILATMNAIKQYIAMQEATNVNVENVTDKVQKQSITNDKGQLLLT